MVQQASPAVFTLTIDQLLASGPNPHSNRNPVTYIQCPLDPAHRMPSHRLQWHLLNRCKRAKQHQLYHCPYDFSHCFLTQSDLNEHSKLCKNDSDNQLI